MTRNLDRLGDQFKISLPLDEEGHLGRECPASDCERYFKIKLGTGLKGEKLPVHCPYCGRKGSMDHFHTKSQIEYATSVVEREVQDAAVRDLKDMASDFNRETRGGLLSFNMDVKSSPARLRHYAERELETNVTCGNCTLQYSVYGVFAFCPDCGQHNSLDILDINLEVVERMLALANGTSAELAEKLVENALEDCVSAFDGFGRELCRIHARKAANPAKAEKISFQNLDGAKAHVLTQFGIDLAAFVTGEEWASAVVGVQKRHLFAHKMGVVDEDYVAKTGDCRAAVGRKISADAADVRAIIQALRKIARNLGERLQGQSETWEEKA